MKTNVIGAAVLVVVLGLSYYVSAKGLTLKKLSQKEVYASGFPVRTIRGGSYMSGK